LSSSVSTHLSSYATPIATITDTQSLESDDFSKHAVASRSSTVQEKVQKVERVAQTSLGHKVVVSSSLSSLRRGTERIEGLPQE
jgi:hypothetical protein